MSYQTKYANKKKDDSRSVISQQSKKSAQSEQNKTDMIVKMQQNEEKHKQLMQENTKRRREQEKKLKQQEEEKLRKQSEALNERKKTKEQAYIHYLRNNSKNILNEFKNQNVPKQEKKPAATNQTNQNLNLNFEALDLETSQLHKNKNLHKNFQNHWEDIDVLRKSELLDSLDLSTCKSKRAKDNKQPGLILTDLKEENSESEDELWKQTFKNGKIQKQADRKVDSRTPIWTDQLAHQADDVISKISHKSKSPLPIPPQPQKVEKHSQSQQRQQIVTNIQPTQQIKQQQPKFEQPKVEQVQPERKPPSNIKITTNIQPKPQRQQQQVVQNNNQKSLISEDGNYIKEFLKEDLMNINNVELQLQKELQLLNKENKQKIEQVNQKYGVRDLHTSSQVNRNVFVPQQGPIKSVEDQIEASLLKLDIMLQQPNQGSTQVVVNNIRPQVQQFQQPQQQIQYQPAQQQYQPAQQQNTQQYQNVQQTQQISQDYERQLLEQQVYLQQQLLFAQQQLQQHKLQSQQQSQNQTMQSNKMDLPQFPKFQTHQDHNEFMEASQQTNKPRNVSDQNSSIVPSQASQDKYNFDVDFKQPNSYQKQQQKKVQQKQSLVKPIQENIEEESQDGKIEVRQDLRNLLFD